MPLRSSIWQCQRDGEHYRMLSLSSLRRKMLRCAALVALLIAPTTCASILTLESVKSVFSPDLDKSDDLSDLHYGSALGDIGAVERAIAEGANINGRDARGWSPLVWAANRGRPVILNLIAAGADLDLTDAAGSSAVLHAVVGGHLDVADALVGSGANPNKGNDDGLTPLAVVLETADDARALNLCVIPPAEPLCQTCAGLPVTLPRPSSCCLFPSIVTASSTRNFLSGCVIAKARTHSRLRSSSIGTISFPNSFSWVATSTHLMVVETGHCILPRFLDGSSPSLLSCNQGRTPSCETRGASLHSTLLRALQCALR